MLSIPSTHSLYSRPPTILCGRAGNACTNLLGYLVRYVRSRGIDEIAESGKTTDFRFVLCRTHSPRMACATNSCTRGMNQCTQCVGWRRRDRGRVLKERGTLSLLTFGTFGHAKVQERKSYIMFLYGGSKPYPVSATPFRGGYATLNPPLLHRKVR